MSNAQTTTDLPRESLYRDTPASGATARGADPTRNDRSAPATEDAPEKPTLSLSPSGLAAGAMAAVTSAVAGSQLGTAGTLLGAALGSLIGAVATALYSFSIQRTMHAVHYGRLSGSDAPTDPHADGASETRVDLDVPADDTPPRKHRVNRVTLIVGVALTAVAAFLIALVAITGIEKVSGASLSGNPGTTVQHIQQARGAMVADDTTTQGEQQPDQAAATASPTLTPRPTPSVTATANPSATPAPTTTPAPVSPAPNAGSTGTPAAVEPSAKATNPA